MKEQRNKRFHKYEALHKYKDSNIRMPFCVFGFYHFSIRYQLGERVAIVIHCVINNLNKDNLNILKSAESNEVLTSKPLYDLGPSKVYGQFYLKKNYNLVSKKTDNSHEDMVGAF